MNKYDIFDMSDAVYRKARIQNLSRNSKDSKT